MTEKPVNSARSINDRIQAEMLDSFDEELELEIDDDRLDALTNEFSGYAAKETADQILVLDHRRGAAFALHHEDPRSAEAVEAQPDGRQGA